MSIDKKIEKLEKKQKKQLEKIKKKEAKKREKEEKKKSRNKNIKRKFLFFKRKVNNTLVGENKYYIEKEEIDRKLKKVKLKNKIVIALSWTIISIIILSSILLITKKGMDRLQLRENTQKIEMLEKTLIDTNVYNSKMDNFAKNFITIYINATSEKQKERKEQLENYYLKGIKDNLLLNDKVSRNLTSIRLYSSERIDTNNYIYRYIINYTLTAEDNKKNKQEMINISISSNNNNYSISQTPYFSDIPKDISSGEYQEKKIDLEREKDKRVDIENFTKDFFKKYTSYTVNEMQYLMKTPEVITGKELGDIIKIEVYKDNNHYLVYTELHLVEKEMNLQTVEKFYLRLSIKDNKYFVEELKHH